MFGKSEKISNTLKRRLAFVGHKGVFWLLIGSVASLSLAVVEYSIAAFLQVFLVRIGLASIEVIPKSLQAYASESIVSICFGLVLIGVVRAASLFFSQHSSTVFSETLNARLRLTTIYEMLLKKENNLVSLSDVNTRFGEIFPKAGLFLQSLSQSLTMMIQLFFLSLGMLWVAWRETIVGLIGLFAIGYFIRILHAVVRRTSEKIPGEQSRIMKSIERVTKNWVFIKISGTQDIEYSGLVDKTLNYFNYVTRGKFFVTLAGGVPPLAGIMLLGSITLISQSYFGTAAASLLTFLYLFIRFVQQLGTTVNYFGSCHTYKPHFDIAMENFHRLSAEELIEALRPAAKLEYLHKKTKTFHAMSGSGQPNAGAPSAAAPDIRVEGLGFRWSDHLPWVLRDRSLYIPPRTTLGIIDRKSVV